MRIKARIFPTTLRAIPFRSFFSPSCQDDARCGGHSDSDPCQSSEGEEEDLDGGSERGGQDPQGAEERARHCDVAAVVLLTEGAGDGGGRQGDSSHNSLYNLP